MDRRTRRAAAFRVLFALALAAAPDTVPEPAAKCLPRTHAHNDYLHAHPLLDALHNGFAGVEADVWLVGDELRVAHDEQKDWSKALTLRDGYLEPMAGLVKKKGSVYGDGAVVVLLIDIKSAAEATYGRLHLLLDGYSKSHPGLLTTYQRGGGGRTAVRRGALSVIISGNRPRASMAAQAVRYAAYDGRLEDVGPDIKDGDRPEFVALISDNWNNCFTGPAAWDGTGDMPAATRDRLRRLVADVHGEGKMLRFWNLPKDAAAVWGPLYDAGVDLINTDDLEGLAAFVRSRGAGQGR